ncbi:hypothetical protein [Rubrivivax albus]|uniref:hypothetical protein n=1 Tax=Rubrivivax albus TaxID=2499835 RepID=UPI001305179F|nr:hypothetical protein [Rubrivivax albus]
MLSLSLAERCHHVPPSDGFLARRRTISLGQLPSPAGDGNWPGPGFPGDRRKLTLAGGAIALKVNFLPPPRTHTDGQERAVANDCSTNTSSPGT